MSSVTPVAATIDDLYRVEGKAELIGGRLVHLMASGFDPGDAAVRIASSLLEYADSRNRGNAFGDNVGFTVPELTSGRESFSPDAAYYVGPIPVNRMRFIQGPPTLAVEVRSENDYGEAAESRMEDKRADYFEAGTLVVWDVDPVAQCVDVYRSTASDQPVRYVRGQIAEAEPAVPGWRMPVDRIFAARSNQPPASQTP